MRPLPVILGRTFRPIPCPGPLQEAPMPTFELVNRSGIVARLGSVLLVFVAACNSAEQPQSQSTTAGTFEAAPGKETPGTEASESVALHDFALGSYSLRLAIGACQQSCPVQVELLQQGKRLDTYTLPVQAA